VQESTETDTRAIDESEGNRLGAAEGVRGLSRGFPSLGLRASKRCRQKSEWEKSKKKRFRKKIHFCTVQQSTKKGQPGERGYEPEKPLPVKLQEIKESGNDKCGWDSEMWVKWGLILRQLKEKRHFRKRVKIEEKAGYFSLFFFRQACPAHHNSTRAE
jgi:hypothetical protein